MTNYREILRLSALGLSQQSIAQSCNASKRTVNTVLKAARRENISWPLDNDQTNAALGVDGLLSKKLTDVFVRCLLIAAKVNELVTVAHD